MSTSLLEPVTTTDPQTTLRLSQAAHPFFTAQSSWPLPYPISLLSNTESQAKWQTYENIFLACLRTGDFQSAHICLTTLAKRFGADNERITALEGLYEEATAKNDQELVEVYKEYEELLKRDPTIFSVRKRRAALLRSMGKTPEAIGALTTILDASPTDAEAWAELADLYLTQAMYEQAVFCLEEVLLVAPNAWNMHARLGEVVYLASTRSEGSDQLKGLCESMRRFCRSLELCDDYLRGYYGLKVTTNKLLDVMTTAKGQLTKSDATPGDLPPPPIATVKKLNEVSTAKLAEIVRKSVSGEKGWDGYSQAEVMAARELLDRDVQKIQR